MTDSFVSWCHELFRSANFWEFIHCDGLSAAATLQPHTVDSTTYSSFQRNDNRTDSALLLFAMLDLITSITTTTTATTKAKKNQIVGIVSPLA